MTTESRHEIRYWDSCNWISLIAEDEAERAFVCENVLKDMVAGRLTIITSALTLAEVGARRQPAQRLNQANAKIDSFFRQYDFLHVHDVTRSVAEKSRRLSQKHGLKPADAIHLATALESGADVLETWNTRDFLKLRGKVSVNIREPSWTGTPPLM